MLGTLDTLNRFIRLAAILGWSAARWALNSLNAPTVDADRNLICVTELGADTLIELAKIKRLLEAGLSFDVATALWFDIRTIGCGRGTVSAAPFDVIFNSPAVLAQFPVRTVYHPTIAAAASYVNPLYGDTALSWTVNAQNDDPAAAAVVSCIPINAEDLAIIANAAFGAGASISLTVPNLSVLYRHAMLASFLNLRAPAYLGLIQAAGLGNGATLPAVFTRDQVLTVLETAAWVQDSGLGIPNLIYLMTGSASVYATPGYQPSAIPGLLASLGTTLKPLLLAPDSFACPSITATESAAYSQVLVNAGYIDPIGVVLKDAARFPPKLTSAPLYDPQVSAPTASQT